MKIGKVPENVLKRAVFKQIHHRRQEVLLHPGVGEDCAAVAPEQGEVFVLSTDPITGADKQMGVFAVHITANRSGNGRSGADRYFEQHYFAAGDGGTGPQTNYERIGAGMR